MKTRRVLVVEDDESIAGLLRVNLESHGYEVELQADGLRGLERALAERFDLLILDLTLPGIDGLEICRRLRSERTWLPIMMLTARSSEIDRVLGLEIGADDYLSKPFSVRELLARVKAIFRRVDAIAGDDDGTVAEILEHGELTIDNAKRTVRVAGSEIELTAREFDLLAFFARNPGRVFTRTQLLDQVWGMSFEGYQHTVNTHINRLRGKIESDPAKPVYVLTVWGVGYKMAESSE